MTDENSPQPRIQLDDRLLTWAEILAGAGGVLLLAGVSIAAAALRRGAQQWIRQLDQPPSELARTKWQQLMTAKAAGTHAWKNGSTTKAPTTSS